MKTLFHFLGGVRCAVLLIASALLFVIGGTFLESWSDSHLFAAAYTYKSPLFLTLLWLFFINILFAALRRWPFKKKHIPFLLTHLGLLMILGGTLVKNTFGTQGTCLITEGAATNQIFLPNSYALAIETRDERCWLPLKPRQTKKLNIPFKELSMSVIDWTPHGEEKLLKWIKDGMVYLSELPPFSVFDIRNQPDSLPPSLEVEIENEKWFFYAALTDKPLERSTLKKPCIVITQDASGDERLWACNTLGKSFEQIFGADAHEALYILDKGFKGYQLFVTLPGDLFRSHRPVELTTPLARRCNSLAPLRKKEELTPKITLLVSDGIKEQTICLTLDKYGSKLMWPILDGKALIRFQLMQKKLPYTVRLREGRKIDYPLSERSFSFESDLLITHVTGKEIETTLSMNRVFQATDGTRFYMSNLQHPIKEGAKKVQLVINRDPAKFFLTYPGGAILGCGMILLFCMVRKR